MHFALFHHCFHHKNILFFSQDFLFQQTMYRIKDPRASLPFYTGVLGMTLLQKLDFPEAKFSLYFLGYENPSDVPTGNNSERTKWAMSRKATVELTQLVYQNIHIRRHIDSINVWIDCQISYHFGAPIKSVSLKLSMF